MPLKFSYEDFVTAWQEGQGIQAMMDKFKCSRNTIENTAQKLKKMGVQLRRQGTHLMREKPDVNALNALIANLGNGNGTHQKYPVGTQVRLMNTEAESDMVPEQGVITEYEDGMYTVEVPKVDKDDNGLREVDESEISGLLA